MSDFDYEDQDEFLSLDDLDHEENSEFSSGNDDWGDSYDDMDSEAWDKEYRGDEMEELEDDPWALS